MEYTVEVIEAFKSYGKKCPVLRGLCMKVPRNTIYGLLGPSGCGKTTLLLSIVGYNSLDSGEVVLNGPKRKRDIGFMPQEISLFEDFTVEETCTFFTAMYGLDKANSAREARRLISLLELPMASSRLVKNLSGGQQRRLSLVVTLLHRPQLLILDEPTVGLDCILTVKIWDHLVDLAKHGTTIVITTHYIQEAVRCNTVGMMRGGQLLTEGDPTALIESHNVGDLEEVFLKLCFLQNDSKEPPKDPPPYKKKTIAGFTDEIVFNKDRYSAYMYKQYCFFKRNILQLLYVLLYPPLIAIIYELATNDPTGIPIGFRSQELVANNCSHPTFTYYENINCSLPPVSCSLRNQLASRNPVLDYYDDSKANQDLHDNVILGYVYLNENYTSNLIQRFSLAGNTMSLSSPEENFNVTLGDSLVYVEKANYILSRFANSEFTSGHMAMYEELLSTCNLPTQLIRYPISFMPMFVGMDQPFRASAIGGLLTGFSFYYPLLYTAVTIMWEKTQGLVKRNTLAGVTYTEIVLAHLSWQYLILFVQDTFSYIILFQAFPLPSYMGSDWQIIILVLVSNSAGVASGFLFTELFNVEIAVVYAVCFSMVGVFNLSGILWPIEGAWGPMKIVASLAPGSSLHRSYPSTIFRGFGLDHFDVYFGVVVNIFWIAVCGVVTAILYRYNRKNS